MGIFLQSIYDRDRNGRFYLKEKKIVEAPHDTGRWDRSIELDKQHKGKFSTSYQASLTKSNLNKKVTHVVSDLDNGERVVYDLISTSNKLSKANKEKYKNIKGCKFY